MAPEKYLITGLKEATGIHPRKDITQFMDPSCKQWNLFLAALRAFHDLSEEDQNPLGFYQIAGIHGAPFIHWMEAHEEGDRPMDYCTHRTALFLTWHRPYLLLLEQRIVEEAAKIAAPLGEEYKAEARKIRFPYWDWATNSNVPAAAREPKINVSLPEKANGPVVTRQIDNPLYSYKFQKASRLVRDFTPVVNAEANDAWQDKNPMRPNTMFTSFMETKRCPELNSPWKSDMVAVDSQLQGHIPDPNENLPTDWRNGIYRLLLSVPTYGDFSNAGWKGGDTTAKHISLESYHNSIHNYTGTNYGSTGNSENPSFPNGHMTEVSMSAFDPIFWLHHCNIDRLYAMWQAIHYESNFEEQTASTERLPAVPEAAVDSGETLLRPFYHKQPQDPSRIDPACVWISNMVQKNGSVTYPGTFEYGYNYVEVPFQPANEKQREELRDKVIANVNRLYSPIKLGSTMPPSDLPDGLLPGDIPGIERSQFRREWVANIHVKNYLLSGNFTIFIFLGTPSEDPSTWVMSPHLAGTLDTFKAPSEYCINCATQREADAYIATSVDLTHILYNQTTAKGLGELHDEEKMREYLKEHLCWRLMRRDRRVVDIAPVLEKSPDALTVSVASFYMSYPQVLRGGVGAPQPGEPKGGILFGEKMHPDVTHKSRKVGGLKMA